MYTPYDANGDPLGATVTSYFFGGALEKSGSTVKKYYAFAGQTVAMKDADFATNGFKYFLSDHLGSTALVLSATGTILEQQRYLPFGQPRSMAPYATISSTDFTYTGQRSIPDTGLMDYKARFYSPSLGRFIQPDSVIPGAANPQAWNRYSYGLNNPSRYTDPTGHMAVSDSNEAGCSGGGPACIIDMYGGYDDDDGMMDSLRQYVRQHEDYNPQADPELSLEDQTTVSIAMFQGAADDAAHTPNMSLSEILKKVLPSAELTAFYSLIVGGPPDFNMMPDEGGGGWSTGRGPKNEVEQAAWDKVLADPWNGRQIFSRLDDPRWPAEEGWVKMERTFNGVEIHWNLNTITGAVEDMKIK